MWICTCVCNNMNIHALCFSADVLGGSVDEPLEPGGVGEERPREFPHPLTADHHKDQRGEKLKGQRSWSRKAYCPLYGYSNSCSLSVCLRRVLMWRSRFRSSVSTSWWCPSPSCSPPHCFRYKLSSSRLCQQHLTLHRLSVSTKVFSHELSGQKGEISSSFPTTVTFVSKKLVHNTL